ncbi:MAG: enoyl-CoA hydratase/isomerase family protein [Chloroflexi bacterium]|nr:enoyl-CoA hydratase/isomerase family protein [Chloroflexota bacterium]
MSRTTTPRSQPAPERRPRGLKPDKPVGLAIAGGIARISLARPESANRIDVEMAAAIREAALAAGSDSSVRVVLLTGTGWDFCVGGPELSSAGPGFEDLRVAVALASIPQPVVAALRGRVFDQGLELAIAADIRIAATGTRLAMRQVVGGGFPFDGGTQRLPRIAGRGLAAEMLLLGRIVDAKEALRTGLVAEVVPLTQLQDRVEEIARQIAVRGTAAARFAKEAIGAGSELPIDSGMRLEADLSILLHHDPDRMERLTAWRRRKPPFSPPGRRLG